MPNIHIRHINDVVPLSPGSYLYLNNIIVWCPRLQLSINVTIVAASDTSCPLIPEQPWLHLPQVLYTDEVGCFTGTPGVTRLSLS
jgi:hypothetical protein